MASKLYMADKTLFLLREYLEYVDLKEDNKEQAIVLYEQILDLSEVLFEEGVEDGLRHIPCQIIGKEVVNVFDDFILNDLNTNQYFKVRVMNITSVEMNEHGEMVTSFIGKSLYR